MYTTRGQMCDAMQKEIDNLEAELADAKLANSYNADVMMQMADEISELRKDRVLGNIHQNPELLEK